jgi:hypothetical protein
MATEHKLYRNMMCAQSLRCLKSKYLLFFPARWVSRHLGRDIRIYVSQMICFDGKNVIIDSVSIVSWVGVMCGMSLCVSSSFFLGSL